MKKWIGVSLVLVSTVASAAPTPLVTPPAGWNQDPEASASASMRAAQAHPLGAIESSIVTQAFVPTEKGVALYVTRASAQTGTEHGAAARAAVDAFTAAPERAKGLGGTVSIDAPAQTTTDAQQHVVTLTWSDTAQGLTTASRLVIAASKLGVVTVSGECMWSRDVAKPNIDACTHALATLDTGVAVADRVPVVLATVAAPPPAPEPPPAAAKSSTAPSMSEPARELHVEVGSSSRETDKRPVYVGAGVVVLALIFWWNRRRRDELDRARATDDDADDLHAAARDDAKDEDA